MSTKDVIIIGGGPAGITFARNYRKFRPGAEMAMFRPEHRSMVYCAIPYCIEGELDMEKLFKKDELVTDIGVELIRRRAVSVNFAKKTVTDEEGVTYGYETLFICTGAVPARPKMPGADAPNVYTVKTGKDTSDIIERIKNGARRAVVVGAGAIGIEQAQAYRKRGVETWLVEAGPNVLPNMLDADMAAPLAGELEALGVKLLTGSRVEALAAGPAGVGEVKISGGETVKLDPEKDFVCFAVGMVPDTGLFADSGLAMDRDGIIVDQSMRTNIPGVLAAGDCCSFRSAIDGAPIGGKLATAAVPMAKAAARTAAGLKDSFPGFYNGAATCVGRWRVGATGFTAALAGKRGMETLTGHGEATTTFPIMAEAGPLKVKIVAEQGTLRIVGGQVLSEGFPATDKTDILTLAVQRRMTLRDLSRLSYSAQPLQSFFPAANAIVLACENALDALSAAEAAGPDKIPDCV
ncbi:MAG: FAD-dependent oxidoreductase [Elusimicrobiales bacterium]